MPPWSSGRRKTGRSSARSVLSFTTDGGRGRLPPALSGNPAMTCPSLADLPPPPPGQTGWPWTEAGEALPAAMPGGEPWPRISIITPSYNQAETLEESLRSVLLQGYPELEYVVVDGGSRDGSADVIRRYAAWLTHWESEPDRGQSHAINKGLARASGEIAAWLNSDDLFNPGTFRVIAEAFAARPEAAVIYGNCHLIDRAGTYAADGYAEAYERQRLLRQANPIPQPSAFFRRRLVQAAGGLDENLHFAMDYDLWLRLGLMGPMVYIPEVCSKIRIHQNVKTNSGDQRMFAEIRQVSERHGGQGLPAGYADWLASIHLPQAFRAYQRGDAAAGQRELAYVMEYVPAWQADGSRLIREIVSRAWRLSPGLTGDDQAILEFAERVCNYLPPAVAAPAKVRRLALGRLYEGCAFRRHSRGESRAAVRCAWQAASHDATRLTNRGLWSIALRSALGGRRASAAPAGPALGERLLGRVEARLRQGSELPADPAQPLVAAGHDARALRASCSAVSILGLLGRPENLQKRWQADLLACQDPASGLFLGETAQQAEALGGGQSPGCAWQTTQQALEALARLGATQAGPLKFVRAYASPAAARQWLASLDWSQPDWLTSLDWGHPRLASSARVMFLVSFLSHEAQRTGAEAFARAAHAVLDWLDERQDPESGYWVLGRSLSQISPKASVGHFAHLYLYLGRPVRYAERLIDSTLGLQQMDGLFDPQSAGGGRADLAAVDLLVKLSLLTDYRAETIKLSLGYACDAILTRFFGRMAGPPGDADLPATRMRLLALALISSRYPADFIQGIHWQFSCVCAPGWHDAERIQVIRRKFYS
jgi:GT2 family glycosyltransferase